MKQAMVVSGVVRHGYKRGRRIGIPTINLQVPASIKSGQWGIYITLVKIGKSYHPGVTHLGPLKSFDESKVTCETFLLDQTRNLYHKSVKVVFLKKIRAVKKFKTIKALTAQINKDVLTAKVFFDL